MFVADLINGFFDLLCAPFGGDGRIVLGVVSALAGVALLLLFKVATPQARLSAARGKLTGHLYELGLYQDDLGVLFRVQKDLALANLRYLSLTLPSLLLLIPIVALVLVQLEARLQYDALEAGDVIVVEAVAADGRGADLDALSLDTGDGLALDAPAVRDRSTGTIWWRLSVEAEGLHEFAVVDADGERWTKAVKAVPGAAPHGLVRERGGLLTALSRPAEPPLPDASPLASITVHRSHPEADWFVQGWFWWFCALSVAAGLAVKGVFRVEM